MALSLVVYCSTLQPKNVSFQALTRPDVPNNDEPAVVVGRSNGLGRRCCPLSQHVPSSDPSRCLPRACSAMQIGGIRMWPNASPHTVTPPNAPYQGPHCGRLWVPRWTDLFGIGHDAVSLHFPSHSVLARRRTVCTTLWQVWEMSKGLTRQTGGAHRRPLRFSFLKSLWSR